jgi:hypothetical protein
MDGRLWQRNGMVMLSSHVMDHVKLATSLMRPAHFHTSKDSGLRSGHESLSTVVLSSTKWTLKYSHRETGDLFCPTIQLVYPFSMTFGRMPLSGINISQQRTTQSFRAHLLGLLFQPLDIGRTVLGDFGFSYISWTMELPSSLFASSSSAGRQNSDSGRDPRFASLSRGRPGDFMAGGVQNSFRERPPAPIKIDSGNTFKDNPFLKNKNKP